MKKCPYCSAELLDESEFCLYCMRQLTKKTDVNKNIKRSLWPFVVISVLLALLACAIILLIIKFGSFHSHDYFSSGSLSSTTSMSQDDTLTENERVSSDVAINNGSSETDYEPSSPDNERNNNNSSNYIGTVTSNNSETEGDDKKDDLSDQSSESSEGSSQTSSTTSSEDSTSSTPEVQTWSTKKVTGGLEIVGIANYNSSGNYEIPSQIDGKKVVGIGSQAFYYEQGIKSITLPDTLKYIGEQAFAYCDSLTQIVIPASVTEIRNNAFLPCKNLANIYIKSTNITIATYAFSNSNQRNVTLTIHAPLSTMDSNKARLYWSAEYKEWYG